MFQQHRFRDDGTQTSGLGDSENSNDRVGENKYQIAHSRVLPDENICCFPARIAIRQGQPTMKKASRTSEVVRQSRASEAPIPLKLKDKNSGDHRLLVRKLSQQCARPVQSASEEKQL
jgi:hypothetical protein